MINYQKDIDNFIKVVAKDNDIDLTTFYKNLETLTIGLETDDLFNMGYDNLNNQIFFNDEETYYNSINHELFHVASNKIIGEVIYSGFYKWDKNTKTVIGLGLNEGYTELLQNRYFNKYHGYPIQKIYIEQLEQIIDPITIKKAYFSSNLSLITNELKKYAEKDEIIKFITGLDIYTVTINRNLKEKPYSYQEIQSALTYCSCFLIDVYIKKMILERPKDIVDKVLTYFGNFDKRFRFTNYPEINIAVPLEKGFEILEAYGFKRK